MILCIGTTPVFQRTLVFDRLALDEVNRAVEVAEYASGKVINVVHVAHTLGADVTATGFLGGETGKFIRHQLNDWGVNHDFVTVDPKTRICTTVIDRAGGTVTELVEEAAKVSEAAWDELRARTAQMIASAKVIVLSGSQPPGGPTDFFAFCAELGAQRQIPVIVDAAGQSLQRTLAKKPLLVKPNRNELAKTLGLPIDSEAALRHAIAELINAGATWALVTEGKAGAILSNGKQFWRVRSPAVQAVNPIGSGDSLAAGFAVAISRGQSPLDACKLGIACGAANAMTDRAGHVKREDVDRLAAQVEVVTD